MKYRQNISPTVYRIKKQRFRGIFFGIKIFTIKLKEEKYGHLQKYKHNDAYQGVYAKFPSNGLIEIGCLRILHHGTFIRW